jgi:hypothetical protein
MQLWCYLHFHNYDALSSYITMVWQLQHRWCKSMVKESRIFSSVILAYQLDSVILCTWQQQLRQLLGAGSLTPTIQSFPQALRMNKGGSQHHLRRLNKSTLSQPHMPRKNSKTETSKEELCVPQPVSVGDCVSTNSRTVQISACRGCWLPPATQKHQSEPS